MLHFMWNSYIYIYVYTYIIFMESETTKDNSKRDSIFSANRGDERRSLSKIEIISIRIIERWDDAINTMQLWRESLILNNSREEHWKVKSHSCLYAIYLMSYHLLKRQLTAEVFIQLKDSITNSSLSADELQESFFIINAVLDEFGLVRVDPVYKKKSVEEINGMKGMD